MAIKTPSGSYDRVLLVHNPYSTNAVGVNAEIASVEQLGLPYKLLATECKVIDMQQSLDDELQPDDVVVVWSGDGGASVTARAMLDCEVPVVLRPGGNANDAAAMINARRSLAEIITTGRAINVRPLEVTTGYQGRSTQLRQAIGYFSIGGSALASERLDAMKYQTTSKTLTEQMVPRRVREAGLCLRMVATAPEFVITTSDGNMQIATDRTFARGDRYAELGKTHANLDVPEFEDITTYTSGYASTLSSMLKLSRGWLRGVMRSEVAFTIDSRDQKPLTAQYDGETSHVASGSSVKVGISERSYRTITTRL